ncbi:hypothetical protein BDR04DRAFT_1104360 [Suillus decipiens]|nr:hypothetical protein BDR04DRAFT_1104360 [Suillus decipiens]
MHFPLLAVISALTAFMSVSATSAVFSRQECVGSHQPCGSHNLGTCCPPFVCVGASDVIPGICNLPSYQ